MGTVICMILSFIIAVLSGMGVGGGGLFVIFLVLLTDLPQLSIQGMNLLFFMAASGSALLIHLSRRHILGMAVLCLALFGIVGSLLGTLLSARIPQDLLRKIFGVMLVITGILSLGKKK